MNPPERAFARLLEEARGDPNVLGIVLGGSRGKGAYVHEASDFDAYVVVHEQPDDWTFVRGGPIERVFVTLEDLRATPAWNRYAFAHVEPALDKTDGVIEEALAVITTVDPTTAGEPLDAYVNALYRSLRNHDLGLRRESHLDAAESVPWLLEFLFTVHARLRPYNKYLGWELETHPLPDGRWTAERLVPELDAVVSRGAAEGQRELFRSLEDLARARGFGDVVDGWEPDVAYIRGD